MGGINDLLKIGKEFQRLRLEKWYTQEQVAEMLNLPRTTYANYESGKREPSAEIIVKVAGVYGVSVSELLGREVVIRIREKPLTDYTTKELLAELTRRLG